ncbi:MAG: tripartite tricarboxylate transporter TctB family protein [Acetobacteraceae bacterium]
MSRAAGDLPRGPSQRAMECAIAVAMILFGAIGVWGSLAAGVGWGAEGPKSGFFPFIVSIGIICASLLNLISAARQAGDSLFATWHQLRQVVSVLVPSTIYVVAMPWTGLYLASFVLIAGFMVWLGRYRVWTAVAVAAMVMIFTFVTFERWFLVPLPKGPIEDLLGL